MVDAFQRSVLFLDLLRQRGNEEIEITSRPMATVLRFDHEVLMSGRSLPRPINYHLSRIVPPPGSTTDPRKRPVVVVDPRAGQGPGIGGFKAESEIGNSGVIPDGMAISIFRWREKKGGEDFHARYVFTDKGGIGIDAGLSAEGKHQTTIMHLMSRGLVEQRVQALAREATVYELVTPVLQIDANGYVCHF